MAYSITALNAMDQTAFVDAVGFVFEETPAIAAHTYQQRPFCDRSDLHQKMVARVEAMPQAKQLALICAHPDLGSKAKMADASVKEQARAGLDQLTSAEYEQFQSLNQAYKDKFNFPFIIAVKDHTKTTILAAFQQRLQHDRDAEINQALAQICRIAWFRLADCVQP
ncbi:2-oxo-4-hydroxy-4-carboxy-5-ureidoimidazoline decarboxylase [Myxacorys almedinensis A]|uniref:2-oxo-4-hydroxy-4-carboxy-5-ureidoimidazoline decarboxylase n=2 Tax=Myxacorys TaxID=2056239 RepID=A0A8J7YYW8_9CYAN|nr:2-oxo-4-hydroxy-4-carboxy-5-ureidoimidazoline decarboxylase [Myxacorys almedinensis A]